jgi:hypothetical protein
MPGVSGGALGCGWRGGRVGSGKCITGRCDRKVVSHDAGGESWPGFLAFEREAGGGGGGGAGFGVVERVPGEVEECDVLRPHGEAARVQKQGTRQQGVMGKEILPAGVVEQAIALYLVGGWPRLIAP